MPRFSKGTTDHDRDGRMGGSMKGDVTMAKRKTAAKKAPAEKAATAAPADVKTRGAALDEQLADADAKAKPDDEEAVKAQEEADRIGRQVRGF